MTIRLYGVDGSQPVRSVKWLLEMKNIPFEFVYCMPGHKKGTRAKDFVQRNPTAHVPFIEDDETGVSIAEGAAILAYIASKHGLDDMYPAADLKKRAAIDEYLHWHHRNTRNITVAFFAPVVRLDIKMSADVIKSNTSSAYEALRFLEARLATQDFLCGASCTIADLFAYPEIAQCRPDCCNLLSFSDYPNISRWFERMAQLPGFASSQQNKGMQKLYQYVRKNVAKRAAQTASQAAKSPAKL